MSDAFSADPHDFTALAVRALVLYSLAEFQSGNASTIRVGAEGTSFSVADDGRGHAINRTVAGTPYLQFVYTHLDYPFALAEGRPVQLHGIGLSLLNMLSSELSVTASSRDGALRIAYRAGRLFTEERSEPTPGSTGTAISGTICPHLQAIPSSLEGIKQWLQAVLACSPSLNLHFNGEQLHASQRSAV
jgi:DNA gyrase/topoisomerase IV subunit B